MTLLDVALLSVIVALVSWRAGWRTGASTMARAMHGRPHGWERVTLWWKERKAPPPAEEEVAVSEFQARLKEALSARAEDDGQHRHRGPYL